MQALDPRNISAIQSCVVGPLRLRLSCNPLVFRPSNNDYDWAALCRSPTNSTMLVAN
jgi:hypothetical protein